MSNTGTESEDMAKTLQAWYSSGWSAGYHAAMLRIESFIQMERAKVNMKP